ncbi:MAG: CRISPR-associated endonuclease Cas2 [Cyanobacteria bacterium SID2]|nr:CRISPR-associated endonuclease Cas2 [Cyanobacteria bacterium SID2]MBP0002512.1 CRISPR-associated endonuclease Cas2 [Cyanobacteria bacterium SBC]
MWLVCFDVRNDRRRSKLAKLLEQRCQRVQYLVFECPIDEKMLDRLLKLTF